MLLCSFTAALANPRIIIWLLIPLVAYLTVLVWMRFRIAASIHRAVSMISNAAGISVSRTAIALIPEELERARRYQKTLTLAVAHVQTEAEGNSTRRTSLYRSDPRHPLITYPVVAFLIRSVLRKNDTIGYDTAKNQYLLLLVEVNKSDARYCLQRIEQVVRDQIGVVLRTGTAQFPDDGYTTDELVKAAQRACDAPPISVSVGHTCSDTRP